MNALYRHLPRVGVVDFGARPVNGDGPTATRWTQRFGALATGLALLQVVIGVAKVRTGLPLATTDNVAATLLLVAVAALNHRLAHATGTPLSGDRR